MPAPGPLEAYTEAMRPSDTTPEAWEVLLAIQRRLTPTEKFAQVLGFSHMIGVAAADDLRRRYPGAGDREIFLRTVRTRLGLELFQKVYGTELHGYESTRSAA